MTKLTELEKKVLSFILPEQTDSAVIDYVNDSVKIAVAAEADMTKLKPVITVSSGTTINPASGTEVDFSKGPVKFTITATDGSSKDWFVRVTRIPYTGNSVLDVSISGQISKSSVSTQFQIVMPGGTNFTSLAPVFTLSPGATINPASGQAVDFSQGPVTYTVTAENGKTKAWSVYPMLALITADNSNINYVGRINMSNVTAPKFCAPGVYIRAKFTGTFCDIDIADENAMNYIVVAVDNLPTLRILVASGKKTYRVASGLSSGEHSILICKETEGGVGSLTFYGFRCEGLSIVTDIPVHKIECYGNSIICGAKILSGTPCDLVNNNKNWNAANSAYLSYGAVAARSLNADWQITAVSGIGLIHNCCGGTTMPYNYDTYLGSASSDKWDFTRYVPEVVTICLGQNDGATNVASSTFKNAYVAFINTIRSKYADASIFCVTSPMADSSSSSACLFKVMKTALASIVDSVNKAGDTKVYWIALPHDQNNGCTGQGHPSEAEHAQTAAILVAAIKAKMGW